MKKKVVVVVKELKQELMSAIVNFPDGHSDFLSDGVQFTFDTFSGGKPSEYLLKAMFAHAAYSAVKSAVKDKKDQAAKFMIFSTFFDGNQYTELSSFGTPISCNLDGGTHMSVEDEFRKLLSKFREEMEVTE